MLDGGDKRVDKAVIIGASDARVPPSKIFRIAKAFLVVCADVQNDGESARWMNSADEAIERKFANWNAEPADTLVADAQNALAVGDDDHVNLGIWMIAQERRNRMAQRVGNEEAARTAVDVAEFLAAERDDRRIDDRQHFIDVAEQQTIEKNFVGVLKLPEIDVALEIIGLERKSLICADGLVIERFNDRRKEPVKAKQFALVYGESGAFVKRRIVEEFHPAMTNSADDVGR